MLGSIRQLARLSRTEKVTSDQVGRYPYPLFSLVVDNLDPEGLGRVKVANPANPALATGWLYQSCPAFDSPTVPLVGETVLVLFAEGIPEQGIYFPIKNRLNPPLDQPNRVGVPQLPKLDYSVDRAIETPRNVYQDTVGHSLHSAEEYTVIAKRILLATPLRQAFIALSEYGILIESKQGITWDLGGKDLNIVNAGDVTIQGESVTTIGAVDSAGHSLVTRGY